MEKNPPHVSLQAPLRMTPQRGRSRAKPPGPHRKIPEAGAQLAPGGRSLVGPLMSLVTPLWGARSAGRKVVRAAWGLHRWLEGYWRVASRMEGWNLWGARQFAGCGTDPCLHAPIPGCESVGDPLSSRSVPLVEDPQPFHGEIVFDLVH